MARTLVQLLVMVLLACGETAYGADVIFYSDPDEYYGWAAGYNYSQAEAEAHTQCNGKGTQCRFALECDSGWGAIAFADDTAKGVGMSCGYDSALGARWRAVEDCVIASNALCWTSSTFDERGQTRSADDNLASDMTWYAQRNLGALGYDVGDIDAQIGPKTTEALRAFQTKLGRVPTGELDRELFDRLVDAVGGPIVIAEGFESNRQESIKDGSYRSDLSYSQSSQPYPKISNSEALAREPVEKQELALATLLDMYGQPCTVPAKHVEALPEDGSGFWNISCAEGDFTVLVDGQIAVSMSGLSTLRDERGTGGNADAQQAPGSTSDGGTAKAGSNPPASGSTQ